MCWTVEFDKRGQESHGWLKKLVKGRKSIKKGKSDKS